MRGCTGPVSRPFMEDSPKMAIDTRAMSIELAVEYHRAGKLPQAEQIYRGILARDRDHLDANYLLGLIELDRGCASTAAILIAKARDLAPNNPLYHYNLGRALQGEGRMTEAEKAYRKAIHHRHDYIEARYSLGLLLQDMGRADDAVVEYKKLLRIKPGLASVYNNLGNALSAARRYDEALRNLRKSVELAPDYSEGWGNLGNLLQIMGRLDEARGAFEKSLKINPNSAENHYNFGNLLQTRCEYDAAEAHFKEAVRLKPDFAGAYNNLGNIYKLLGRLKESVAAFDSAIRIEPNSADPHNNKGNALVAGGEITSAIESYRKAVELQPGYVDAWSNLVYALNYPAGMDDARIFAEHREWSQRFEWPVEVETIPPAQPAEGRKLRIGYVSGDFRRHSVAFFFEPLLEAHDRSRVEIYCYANIRFADEVTQRIQSQCDGWRPITQLDDNQAAQLIRKDRIDVLVDLSGHTDGNRLLIFARRPAPVQVTWLGYPNTTGLNNMDYRLIDAVTDPPGDADELASERLYRMPNGFLCYRGYEKAPFVLPPPSLRRGHLTFGSFNNLTKVTREVVETWAEVLHAFPDSRLIIKTNQLEDADTRERYHLWFEELGIPRERIDLRARTQGIAEHLNVYGEVDIGLDTFPYNGTTTTCEALWMGVPVIAMEGDNHRSRVSQSILVHAGMGELVVKDKAALIARIRELAADPDALRARRIAMRKRLTASALCDLNGFARAMEEAFTRFHEARLDEQGDSGGEE